MFTLEPLVSMWVLALVLVHVPRLANRIAVTFAKRTFSRLDHAIPDDLPRNAGTWLGERLAMFGIAQHVTGRGAPVCTNAYVPSRKVILLTHDVHFKSDPVFWAIAAHELGHAAFHYRWPRLAWLVRAARVLCSVLVRIGIGLAIGNVLYALPGVTSLAFVLLAIAAALTIVEVAEEAYASRSALNRLALEGELSPVHLHVVRTALRAAFASYVVTYGASALLLLGWPIVERLTGGGLLDGISHLRALGLVYLVVVVAIGVFFAGLSILGAVGTRELRERLHETGLFALTGAFKLLLAGAVWLLWDLHANALWGHAVILAIIPIANVAIGLLSLPAAPPILLLVRALGKLEGKGIEDTASYRRDLGAGARLIERGNAFVKRLVGQDIRGRLACALDVLYLPLFALWLIGGGFTM